MNFSNAAKAAAIVALLGSAPLPAGAIEIAGGSSAAGYGDNGFVQEVVIVRGPHGGAYAGVPAEFMPIAPGIGQAITAMSAIPAIARVYPGYRPGYAGWARPGWYHWGPGGAIAAGAAIGFVGAAAAAAWAPAPPAPGLCWYYTDPSQQSGFWDACP